MWLAFKLHRVEPVLEEGEPWFTRLLHVELENVQGERGLCQLCVLRCPRPLLA